MWRNLPSVYLFGGWRNTYRYIFFRFLLHFIALAVTLSPYKTPTLTFCVFYFYESILKCSSVQCFKGNTLFQSPLSLIHFCKTILRPKNKETGEVTQMSDPISKSPTTVLTFVTSLLLSWVCDFNIPAICFSISAALSKCCDVKRCPLGAVQLSIHRAFVVVVSVL